MAVLDRIMEMQSQGISEAEIARQLRNEGISSREILESLNQVKVKEAVNQPEYSPEDMQQSIMTSPDMQQSEQAQPDSQQQYQAPQQEQIYQQTPQAYSQEYYLPQQNLDTDTITEIAEQVAAEKISEFTRKTGDLSIFKNNVEEKLKDLDIRLRAIENNIDKLQNAIIGKIGEFGETNSAIQKDISNLHNTVSKLMNPLIDNYRELQKISRGK